MLGFCAVWARPRSTHRRRSLPSDAWALTPDPLARQQQRTSYAERSAAKRGCTRWLRAAQAGDPAACPATSTSLQASTKLIHTAGVERVYLVRCSRVRVPPACRTRAAGLHLAMQPVAASPPSGQVTGVTRWEPNVLLSAVFLGALVMNMGLWVWKRLSLRPTRTDDVVSGQDTEPALDPDYADQQRAGTRPAGLKTRVRQPAELDQVSGPAASTDTPSADGSERVGLGETLRQLNKRLRELETRLAEQQKSNQALERQSRELEQRYRAEKARRQALRKELAQIETAYQQLEKRHEEQMAALRSKAEAQLQGLRRTAEKRLTTLQTQLEESMVQAKKWQNRAQVLSAQLASLSADMESLSEREQELRGQHSEKSQRYAALLRAWKQLRTDYEELQSKLDARTGMLDAESEERARLERQNAQLRQQIQAWIEHHRASIPFPDGAPNDAGSAAAAAAAAAPATSATKPEKGPSESVASETPPASPDASSRIPRHPGFSGPATSRKRRIRVDAVDHVLEVGFFRQEFNAPGTTSSAVHPDKAHPNEGVSETTPQTMATRPAEPHPPTSSMRASVSVSAAADEAAEETRDARPLEDTASEQASGVEKQAAD